MPLKARLRRIRFGLATLLSAAPRGYFIPYRHAADMPPPGRVPAYDALASIFAENEDTFSAVLDEIDRLAPDLDRIGGEAPPAPRWAQGWFPGLDAEAAYAIVRSRRPRRIVEIGSGHSTRFLARAIADGGLATRLVAVDPGPRAALAGLAVEHIAASLHEAPAAPLAELSAGDILFVDSSHILMPGTDVDFILNRIWPGLPGGVLVHVHDVFLPDDYPAHWAWRGYNEQQGVGALIGAGAAEPLFASHYVRTRMAEALAGRRAGRREMISGAVESSVWLMTRKAAK